MLQQSIVYPWVNSQESNRGLHISMAFQQKHNLITIVLISPMHNSTYIGNLCFTLFVDLKIHWLYPLCGGVRPTPKRNVLGMTLNCIWQQGSRSGCLGIVLYPFIAITPMSPLVYRGTVSVSSMGLTDLFKKYLYSIGHGQKIFLKKQLHKKCKYECTLNMIP